MKNIIWLLLLASCSPSAARDSASSSGVASSQPPCEALSSDVTIRMVQRSPEFDKAIRLAHKDDPGFGADVQVSERNRMCRELRVTNPLGVDKVKLVYVRAYESLEVVNLVIAVSGKTVAILNPVLDGRIAIGFDVTNWNRFAVSTRSIRVENLGAARTLACLNSSIANNYFPYADCRAAYPIELEETGHHQWKLRSSGSEFTISGDGRIVRHSSQPT